MLTATFLPVQIYTVTSFFSPVNASEYLFFMDQWHQVPCNDCEVFFSVNSPYISEQNRKNVRWSWELVLNSVEGSQMIEPEVYFHSTVNPNHISKELKMYIL